MNTTGQIADENSVHLGYWTDWSHGKLQGATLTLSRRDGGLLIAFLALFTAVVGKSFWRINCFVLHNLLSSATFQDGLYHQRQAILRNAPSAAVGIRDLLRTLWAWRKLAPRTYIRIIPLLILAAMISLGFAVASIFSSHIVSGSVSDVLVASPNCGDLSGVGQGLDFILGMQELEMRQAAKKALSYATECYEDRSSIGQCNTFTKRRLPKTIDRNAGCPFDDEICLSNTGNIVLDSGYIDSNEHLGLNTPPELRFLYRLLYRCSPLKTEGYSHTYTDLNTSTPQTFTRYYYGQPTDAAENDTFTFQWRNDSSPTYSTFSGVTHFMEDYSLNVVTAFPTDDDNTGSDFKPISALKQPDADITLVFLTSNQIMFQEPVDDLWYSAHKPSRRVSFTVNVTSDDTSNKTFASDQPVNVLGCTRQQQFCNPSSPGSPHCTQFYGIRVNMTEIENLWAGTHNADSQQDFVTTAADLMVGQVFAEQVPYYLGLSALTARDALFGSVQDRLPDNQWQLETEHWFDISLASLQALFVRKTRGPDDPNLLPFVERYNDTTWKTLCKSQKVISSFHSSFSVMGLGIVLVLGTLLILTDYFLDRIVGFIQFRRYKMHAYNVLEWNTNSTLQLQRLAHEELGFGTWTGTMGHSPVTRKGEKLAILDLATMDHPRLGRLESVSADTLDDKKE